MSLSRPSLRVPRAYEVRGQSRQWRKSRPYVTIDKWYGNYLVQLGWLPKPTILTNPGKLQVLSSPRKPRPHLPQGVATSGNARTMLWWPVETNTVGILQIKDCLVRKYHRFTKTTILVVNLFAWWLILCRRTGSSVRHYSDVIMSAMASQITGVSIVHSTVNSSWPSDAILWRQHIVLKPYIFHYERIPPNLRRCNFLKVDITIF